MSQREIDMVRSLKKRVFWAGLIWASLSAMSGAFYYSIDYKTGGPLSTTLVSADNVLDPPNFWHHYIWKVHNPFNFTLENVGMVRTFSWVTLVPTPGVPFLTDYISNPWDDTNKIWYSNHSINPYIVDGEYMKTSYHNVHDAANGGNIVQPDLFSMSRSNTDVPLSYTPGPRTYNVWDSNLNQEVPYTVNFQTASLSENDNVSVIWLGDIAPNSDLVFDVYAEEEHNLSNVFAGYTTGFYVSTTAVPEPSSMAALAMIGLAFIARRRR